MTHVHVGDIVCVASPVQYLEFIQLSLDYDIPDYEPFVWAVEGDEGVVERIIPHPNLAGADVVAVRMVDGTVLFFDPCCLDIIRQYSGVQHSGDINPRLVTLH